MWEVADQRGAEGQSLGQLHFLLELPVPATVLPIRLGAVDLGHNLRAGTISNPQSQSQLRGWVSRWVGRQETQTPGSGSQLPGKTCLPYFPISSWLPQASYL